MNNKNLIIFDTTLRDGEQSPGASMDIDEKMQIAYALEELNVDIIEAGYKEVINCRYRLNHNSNSILNT